MNLNEKTKQIKKNEGITLISLVITIVVMLILAGVTINLTLEQNGIFTATQKAAKNYTEAQNQEIAGIESFTNLVDKTINSIQNNYEIAGTIIKTENNINYTADGAGNIIPVPVGFSPIMSSDQGTKDTGFVIKNDTDGNEFVWVPVSGMEYTYNRYAMLTSQPQEGLDEDTQSIKIKHDLTVSLYYTEKMPIDEETSVATYGGFYIGRYEAGVKDYETKNTTSDGTTTWTAYTGDDTRLVIQDEQEVWNWITRDKAKTVSEDLYSKDTDNVTSKLCSSYAWDTALKFIETQNSTYPTNSTGANYSIEVGGTGELQKTGYHAVNNIYDMAGNVSELTTESFSYNVNPCVGRGGNYSDSGSAASIRGVTGLANAFESLGFRVALYI